MQTKHAELWGGPLDGLMPDDDGRNIYTFKGLKGETHYYEPRVYMKGVLHRQWIFPNGWGRKDKDA